MAIINNFISGGVDTSELTATRNTVERGIIFYGSGDEEVQVGTLALTGTATVNDVLQGTTFYNTYLHTKLTGALIVNSIYDY